MAPIPPQIMRAVANWRLRFDIDDLEAAYRAALGGLTHLAMDIERETRASLGIGPNDEFPIADPNDPSDPTALLYDDAGERSAQAKRGEPLVRKAFLIALFHAWERHCCKILKAPHCSGNDIRKLLGLTEQDWSVHPVYHLQLAANCAKHGRGPSGAKLYAQRPDMFPRARAAREANEWTLSISAEMLDKWFAAVRDVARTS